ncbi:MAG TPA: hypothetical protein VH595_02805 [Verrucomicrobiae bacterium]|jgi:hypothetical protein|nr:hypothetical protein [Verrucomicrobiae bacterium]
MVESNNYSQLEELFTQEHEELLMPARDAAGYYLIAVAEITSSSSRYASARLAEATTHEDRENWNTLLGHALDRENHVNHPDNDRFSRMRQDAVQKAIVAYRPVVAARREFSNGKRVDLIGAEKEFFGRFGVARVDTHIHDLLNQFERTTNSHELLLGRHGQWGFNTLLPSPIAALVAHSPAPSPIAAEARPGVALASVEPSEELPVGAGDETVTDPSERE